MRIRIRGIDLAYDDEGNGPVVVLLHGYPFDRSMWRGQIEALSAHGYRAIAPDLRGFGEMSDKLRFVAAADRRETERQAEACRTTMTMEDMAHDIAALMDELKIDQAVVCGLSMGGYVAFEFAKLFRERLNGLVLAGTRAPADNDQEKQNREQQAKRVFADGMNGVAEASLPKLLSPRTLAEKPEVVKQVRDMIVRADPRGAASAQHGMAARRDYSKDLSEIVAPTLIIVGREDTIRPVGDAEFMHDGIRNSRLEVIDDAAHMTNMEQPKIFNDVLVRFLETVGQAAGASAPS